MLCGVRPETRAALEQVKVRLALAGAAMAEAVKTSARLCDRDGFPVTDAAHAACSPHRSPARSSAAEARLMVGIAVGVAAIAYAPRWSGPPQTVTGSPTIRAFSCSATWRE